MEDGSPDRFPTSPKNIDVRIAVLENEQYERERIADIARLRDELDKSLTHRESLLAQIKVMTTDHVRDAQEMEEMTKKIVDRYNALKEEKESLELELKKTTKEMADLKKSKEDATLKTHILAERVTEIDDARKMIEKLNARLETQHHTNLRLKEAAEIFEGEVAVLDKKVKESALALDILTQQKNKQAAEIAVLTAQTDHFRANYETENSDKKTLNSNLVEEQERIRRMEWEHAKALDNYEQQLTRIRAERNEIKADAEALMADLRASHAENKTLLINFEKIRLSYVELQGTAQERLGEKIHLKGKNEELTAKLRTTTEEREKFHQQLSDARHNFAKLEIESACKIHDLKARVVTLEKEIEELGKPKKSMMDKIFGREKDTPKKESSSVVSKCDCNCHTGDKVRLTNPRIVEWTGTLGGATDSGAPGTSSLLYKELTRNHHPDKKF